jgi:hypothetical protein
MIVSILETCIYWFVLIRTQVRAVVKHNEYKQKSNNLNVRKLPNEKVVFT